MTAGEEQAQAIVLDARRIVRLRLGRRRRLDVVRQFERPRPTQAIEDDATRDRVQPCRRIARDAVARPRREPPRVRILQRVFGDIKIARQPYKARQHPRAIRADHIFNDATQEHSGPWSLVLGLWSVLGPGSWVRPWSGSPWSVPSPVSS